VQKVLTGQRDSAERKERIQEEICENFVSVQIRSQPGDNVFPEAGRERRAGLQAMLDERAVRGLQKYC
jgi:hypothetical protein